MAYTAEGAAAIGAFSLPGEYRTHLLSVAARVPANRIETEFEIDAIEKRPSGRVG
jgi:hypothetical protein